MSHPIFSYFVKNAIAANQIAATVKFIIRELEQTVAKTVLLKNPPLLQHNVQEQQRKEPDAEIEPPILMAAVIYIDNA